jgi:hypothetical protein
MVDIETLATHANAPIVTIGATIFDPQRLNTWDELYDRAFLRNVDIEDAVKQRPGVDGGTLKWWLQQSSEAIKALVTGDSVSLFQALADFNRYATDRGEQSPLRAPYRSLAPSTVVWANSPSFDCIILESACKAVKAPWPFFFSNWRDVRTVVDLAWPNGPDDRPDFQAGVAHDARADAVAQALKVQAAYAELGLSA